ncbi:hypothetical protein KY332_02855 [Candidatus Woesearchaeota archaeon]|nr:hypothetical protein [Candidatus Woesearchaeota archaeon]
MGEEINITYETLFELLRREKNRDELQRLDEKFFADVAAYLKGKEEVLEQLKTKQDLFVNEEKEKAEKQIEDIRGILKRLYEKREKKIIEMAVDASRTPSVIIDKSIMLDEEKMLYEKTLRLLNSFREGILLNIQHARLPEIKGVQDIVDKEPEVEEKPEEIFRPIIFTHEVPRFVGIDLKEYGPFEVGESAELPYKIADVLINKGRAE